MSYIVANWRNWLLFISLKSKNMFNFIFLCKHNFRMCTSQFGQSVFTMEAYNWNFHLKSFSGVFAWNVRAQSVLWVRQRLTLNSIFPNLTLLIALLRNWKKVIKWCVNQTASSWLGRCKDLFQRLFFFYDVLKSFCHVSNKIHEKISHVWSTDNEYIFWCKTLTTP